MLIILVIIYIYNKIKRKNNSTKVEAFCYTQPNMYADQKTINDTASANIAYLKHIVDGLSGANSPLALKKLQDQTNLNTQSIISLTKQFKTTASEIAGGRDMDSKEPVPQATGLNPSEADAIERRVS